MSTERRLSALSRHLASSSEVFSSRDVYLWLTRDNVELRDKMLGFLKASNTRIQYRQHKTVSFSLARSTATYVGPYSLQIGLSLPDALQDPLYQPQYHLSLKDFRALTLERLKRFTEQRFFRAIDYQEGAIAT